MIDAGSTLLKACGTRVGVDEEIDKKDALALLFGGVEVEAAGGCPIKSTSIDLDHILERHDWDAVIDNPFDNPNKFLPNANVEDLVNQGLSNSSRVVTPTVSEVVINGQKQLVPSYKVEVDMGTQIGTNYNKTTVKKTLRIIIDEEGHVISAYPI